MSLKRRNASYIPTPPRSRGISRRSSSSSFASQVAARAAVAALNTIAPGAGSAVRYAGQAYRMYQGSRRKATSRSTTTTRSSVGRGFSGVSNATYGGKFKTPKKGYSGIMKKQIAYQKTGFVSSKEVFGKVSSPDCVYVGHSTFDPDEIAEVAAIALLRKLFKKSGFNADSPDQELNLADFNDASGFKLQIAGFKATTTGELALVSASYITVNNDTLRTVANAVMTGTAVGNASLKNYILAMMVRFGGSTAVFDTINPIEWERITLYSSDFNVTQGFRLSSEINLREEMMEITVYSTLTVQNRTKSESGSVDAESVDNQPLHGKLYHFSGLPKEKQMGINGLGRLNFTSIILKKAADLSPAQLYKEPPVPTIFTNCNKHSSVNLEPGTVKITTLSQTWKGYFNTLFINKLYAVNTGSQVLYRSPGKTQIVALEERLNSGSTNLITCNYECDRKTMAKSYSIKKPMMLADFKEVTFSNLTV